MMSHILQQVRTHQGHHDLAVLPFGGYPIVLAGDFIQTDTHWWHRPLA